jgi:phospholipid/cholesterol/gamma-HCH transport system substrate-binding protein
MDEQRYRFGVGVLVVSSMVIGVLLIMFFGASPNFLSRRYQVTVNFPAAPGVGIDTPVRKNGVTVGRVTRVNLLPDDRGVDLVLEMDTRIQIRQGETARIGNGSLITGDAVVEFVPPSPQTLLTRFDGVGGQPKDGQLDEIEREVAATYLRDEDYIKGGQIAPDPLNTLLTMQESFAPTLVAIENAGNQVGALAQDLRTVLGGNGGRMEMIVQKTEQTIDNFNETLDSIEAVFNDDGLRLSMRIASERLPKLMEEAEGVMRQARDTVAAFEGVGRAAEETMRNVAEFTEPLGAQGEQIVGDALRTLNNLDALLTDLRQLSSRINSSEGTLNRLLNDEHLYDSVIRTLDNVEQLTRRLQPVVEDVRVFTDKVSRDPRQLGVAGALGGRPVGLGTK